MAGRGGYQAPANPAPVSGPGALSRRTDGGPAQPVRDIPSTSYGEGAELKKLQQGAAMAATPAAPTGPTAADLAGLLDRPSERPDEPVSAGAPFGAGPGPEALPFDASEGETLDAVGALLARAYRATQAPRLRQLIEEREAERA